ncbi:MAG: STAS domain-containing protein [Phycisphaerae bacterium]|nr:STAS domain-containing protein [Phycisphaerae bacterium]
MAIQQWSENIVLVNLQDDPQFTDDLNAVMQMVEERPDIDVVIDFKDVSFLNSSNIAKLLKLRKQVMISNDRQIKLCGIPTAVWGVFLVTGLDKIFEFSDDVANALASLQLNKRAEP